MLESKLYHEQGITYFKTIADALRYGFEIYDKLPEGWLVRKRLPNGWSIAFVDFEVGK